jgi:hypothetical protein
MWLERRLDILQHHDGPIALLGDPCWGASYLIQALNEPERPLVWCELEPRDEGDFVLQGNKLAEAVRRALAGAHGRAPLLFGYGMPFGYGLNVLKRHLKLLGPFTFALGGAEYSPELAEALLDFHRSESRVVLAFNELSETFARPHDALVLTPEALRLSFDEALALVGGRLPEGQTLELWRATEGAYEAFLIRLNEALGLPPPLRPGPEGPRSIPGLEPELAPAQLLDILLRQGRYLEALELAAHRVPEAVPRVLEEAGDFFWTRGLQQSIYPLLANLPEPAKQHELVLMSRLIAALALGKEGEALLDVEKTLAEQASPNLRALYAEALFEQGASNRYLFEAERAAKTKETPLTLYTYGRALGLRDPEAGLTCLERGLRLAESQGKALLAVLIAKALASRQSALGHYQAAVYWAEWGQKLYRESALNQVSLRLSLLNEWAYARILQGGAAGLEPRLRAEIHNLIEVRPSLAELFQTTLADLLLSQGKTGEALGIYRELWRANRQRKRVAALANLLVRALLDAGQVDEALEVARQALELTRGLTSRIQERARLAYGMALSFRDAAQAIAILEPLLSDFSTLLLAERLAQTGLYLARAHLLVGEPEKADSALARAEVGLGELGESGFRYLAGPEEAFYEVKQLLKEQPELELRFLGAAEARLKGDPLQLRPRFAELLAALTLHPEGLSSEQLTLAVYGEAGSAQACMVELGRLKRLVPILSRPYRLSVDVSADFLRLGRLLQGGRLLEALELYQGPLLPQSGAPAVVEMRSFLEESLRQAVIRSDDPEALWTLAQRLGDDLEVWERLLALLDVNDPRSAIAGARTKGLIESYGP